VAEPWNNKAVVATKERFWAMLLFTRARYGREKYACNSQKANREL
jgi:hypothetical protein